MHHYYHTLLILSALPRRLLGTQNATLPYSLTSLALNAATLRPDLVIAYHGFNDYGPATARGYRPDHGHYFRDLAIPARWWGFVRTIPDWLVWSYAANYAAIRADEFIGVNSIAFFTTRGVGRDYPVLFSDSRAMEQLMENWQHFLSIEALARGFGGRALFSTFQFFDGEDSNNQRVNNSLRQFFAEHALPYVDQDALIQDYDRSIQFDVCHLTAMGRRLIAENFFAAIKDRDWVQSPQSTDGRPTEGPSSAANSAHQPTRTTLRESVQPIPLDAAGK